ncbi:MAG: hypothetical protein ACKOW3_01500 [Hyphomicrobium sp.]
MIKKHEPFLKNSVLFVLVSLFISHQGLAEVLPLWKVPLENLAEMQSRPLFSESRRGLSQEPPPPPPPPPPETPVVVAPPETLQATLIGILRSADEFGLAVVKEQSGEKIKNIKIGETFQGWKLSSLSAGTAIFERDGQIVKLQLPKHQFKGIKPQTANTDNNASVPPEVGPPETSPSDNPSPPEPQPEAQPESQQQPQQ